MKAAHRLAGWTPSSEIVSKQTPIGNCIHWMGLHVYDKVGFQVTTSSEDANLYEYGEYKRRTVYQEYNESRKWVSQERRLPLHIFRLLRSNPVYSNRRDRWIVRDCLELQCQ